MGTNVGRFLIFWKSSKVGPLLLNVFEKPSSKVLDFSKKFQNL
jgi:hypothetical protein